MQRRNNFLGDVKRAQEAKRPAPERKPISELSEDELAREAERLRAEDLETMRRYHHRYGMPDVGLIARVRRLVGGGG